MAATARFYHLTRDPPEPLLVNLIGKSLEMGLRVALRARDPARIDALDRALWQVEGFVPHGIAGGPHDARQPVLLTHADTPVAGLPNRPRCLMTLDGAPVAAPEVQDLDRLCILFDGADAQAVETARGQWRALTGAGVAAEYWSNESGRWTCQARHPR